MKIRPCKPAGAVLSGLLFSICVTFLASSANAAQCNWWGDNYPICTAGSGEWGWENNQACVSFSTCNSQPAPYGVVDGASTSSTPPATTSTCGNVPAWNSAAVYNKDDQVHYNGIKYRANWWTQGDNPAQHSGQWQVWSNLGNCSAGGSSSAPVSSSASSVSSAIISSSSSFSSVRSSAASSVSSVAMTPIARHGELHVCGNQLCNQYNEPVQLRGMSTHGIQWYGWGNCLTEASLDALAYDWKADILRIAMYVQEGGYETNPAAFTAQVSRLIDEATERGMYALVDFHQLTPGDPNYNLENAKNFFRDIVQAHSDKTNVIYDVANEPNGNTVTWSVIKSYAEQVIPVIRQYNPDAVVLIGTHGWASMGTSMGRTAADIYNNPVNASNIMYTFHFYAATHGQSYRDNLAWAAQRLPVFVTEFGSQQASGDGANDFASTQAYLDILNQYKISWTNWNYSDDFRSGAVWKTGTCSSNNWSTSNLKEAGLWIRDKIRN